MTDFVTMDEAQAWIAAKSREYGGKNRFLTSDEYRAAYPKIKALSDTSRAGYLASKTARLQSHGARAGQRVEMRWPGSFMSEQYASGTVRMRGGEPWVDLDEPIEGRKRIRWTEAWRPIQKNRRRNPPRYRYLATSDEGDACHCCGRTNLKRYVWLVELDEDGNALGDGDPYGTTCAAHLLRGSCGKKPSIGQAEKIIEAARKEAQAERWKTFEKNYAQVSNDLHRATPPKPEVTRDRRGHYVIKVGDVALQYESRLASPRMAAETYGWRGSRVTRDAIDVWHRTRVLERMEQLGMDTLGQERHYYEGPPSETVLNPADNDAWMAEYDAWEALRDQRRSEFHDEIREEFERVGYVEMPTWTDDSEWTVALTRSARPGVAFQVTDFRGGEPLGHREFDTLDAAIGDLWEQAPPGRKRVPPSPNPHGQRRCARMSRRISML